MKKNGFTLVELLVVCGLMLIVIVPAYRTFSYSSRSFEKNISRNETIQNGQLILNHLKRDLSAIYLVFSNKGKAGFGIDNMFKSTEVGSEKIYEFLSFSGIGMIGNELESKLNKVEYRYDEEKKSLTRTVFYDQKSVNSSKKKTTKVLSNLVNHFEIMVVLGNSHGVKRNFFRPFFHLIENDPKRDPNIQPLLREFMSTIVPETFNSMLSFGSYNRNYHTDIQQNLVLK